MLKKKIGFVSVSVISVSAILDSVSVRFRCIGKIAFRSYTNHDNPIFRYWDSIVDCHSH